MTSVLITGAQGFIGRNLVEYFSHQRDIKLLAPSISDLNLADTTAVDKFFSENAIDFVVHAATVESKEKSYPANVCEVNLRMFFNLLKAKSADTTLISLCSGSVYSREYWKPCMKENYCGQHIPIDGHSYSKYVISTYAEKSDERIVILRLFGVYGKYEDFRFKFVANSLAKTISNIPITINQDALYHYLYAPDLARIINEFISKNITSGVFNVVPNEPILLSDIAQIVKSICGSDLPISTLKPGLGREYTANNSRLMASLGAFEFTSSVDAISDIHKYYLENPSLIRVDDLLEDKFLGYARTIN